MTAPGYLHGIYITETWTHRDVPIVFGGEEVAFRHLVLVGPNGCGKTTTLTTLVGRIAKARIRFQSHPPTDTEAWLQRAKNDLRGWGVVPHVTGTAAAILVYIPASGGFNGSRVDGPRAMDLREFREHGELARASFVQFLVNKRTEQAYAREEGDSSKADQILQWFAGLDANLSELLGQPVTLKFKREPSFSFFIVDKQGRESPFDALPSGWNAVLGVVSKLLIAYEAYDADPVTNDLPAILVIDEPELHLHPGLQWTFLPHPFPHLPEAADGCGDAVAHCGCKSRACHGLRSGPSARDTVRLRRAAGCDSAASFRQCTSPSRCASATRQRGSIG